MVTSYEGIDLNDGHVTRFCNFKNSRPGVGTELKFVNKKFQIALANKLYDGPQNVPGLVSVSDLMPGKYEGGFKVWEGTEDLLTFMDEETIDLKGKRVMDVGCGSGLVGIRASQLGAKHVTFTDFNQVVIDLCTKPNVLLNCPEQKVDDSSFSSGDWSQLTCNQPYDLIFSSETVYNQDNYPAMCSLLRSHLTADGKAFISAKTYYFGVGGGTFEFERFINEDEGGKGLKVQKCKVIDAPVQREILLITKQD